MKRICEGCKQEVDDELCHCGISIDAHTFGDGHSPVSMGCACGYEDEIPDEEKEK